MSVHIARTCVCVRVYVYVRVCVLTLLLSLFFYSSREEMTLLERRQRYRWVGEEGAF